VALEATRRTLIESAVELIDLLQPLLGSAVGSVDEVRRVEVFSALEQTQRFFAQIPPLAEDEPLSQARIAQLHAIDHLMRLCPRLAPGNETQQALAQTQLQHAVRQCAELLAMARRGLIGHAPERWQIEVEHRALAMADLRRDERLGILRQTAGGAHSPVAAMAALDAIRWLERVAYHTWRACRYLTEENGGRAAVQTESLTPLDE
jgi:phosphate:Na+ symporter